MQSYEDDAPTPPWDDGYPSPEDDDVSGDRMKMVAGGLSALGMVYGGLKSFDQWGQLFGEFGEAAAEPLKAVRNFVEEGKKRYKRQGGGTAAKARATLMAGTTGRTDVDDSGQSLTERVRKLARDDAAEEGRLRGLSQVMTEARVNTSIEQMAQRTANQDRFQQNAEDRVNIYKQEIREDMQASRDERYKRLTSPDYGPESDDLNVARTLGWMDQGEDWEKEYFFDRARTQLHENLDSDARLFPDAELGGEEGYQRRAGKLTGQEMDEDRLRSAYERYRSRHPFERKFDANPSYEDLLLLERMDPAFSRHINQELNRRSKSSKTVGEMASVVLNDSSDKRGAPAGPPRDLDPTQSRAFKMSDIQAIAGGTHGDDVADIFKSGKGTVVDNLASQVEEKFNWAIEQANEHIRARGNVPEYDFTMQRVQVDDHHQTFEGRLSQGDDLMTFRIPILSESKGTYRVSEDSRAITHPLQQILSNDLYQTGKQLESANPSAEFQEVQAPRTSQVARPDEVALMKMSNLTNKVLNDLRGARPEGAVSFIEDRIVGQAFRAKSFATTSLQENFIKALTVRDGTENLYQEVHDNPTRRKQFRQGLQSLDKLQNLYGSQSRFFTSDSEFVDAGTRGEAGIPSKAKTPFEVAGSIVDPNEDTSLASIKYRADLSGADSEYASGVENRIREIYSDLAGKSDEEVDNLLSKMKGGGELKIRLQNQETNQMEEIDLLNGNDEKIKGIGWLPERNDDSVDRYYMRVQNAMLEKFGADFAVGQNYTAAEHSVFSKMATDTGVDMHRSITDKNVIDLMNIAHALDPNAGMNSKSLGSITAATFGLDYDLYENARQSFADARDEVKQIKDSGTGSTPMNELVGRTAAKNLKQSQGDIKRGQRALIAQMSGLLDEGLAEADPHTAEFDAFVTGRVALPNLYEGFATTTQGEVAADRARDILNSVDMFQGDRRAVERWNEMDYGGYNADGEYEEGPVPYFANQEGATMGRGVLLNPRMLPLYRLQNPVRQLYQRAKPKRLLGRRGAGSGQTVSGLERRGRLPGQNTQRALKHQERMKNFRKGIQPGVDGPMKTSDEAPMMFAGSGAATPSQRSLYGGYENEMQFSVTSRVAYLPNNHREIYESRGQTTALRREAMKAEPDVRTQETEIDLKQAIGDRAKSGQQQVWDKNKYGSAEMQDWVEDTARSLEIYNTNHNGDPVSIHDQDKARKSLKEAFVLSKIRENRGSGMSSEARAVLDESIKERMRRARGVDRSRNERIYEKMQRSRGGDSTLDVGGRTELFSPDAADTTIVKNPMLGPGNDQMIGLDMSIKFNEDDPGNPARLVFSSFENAGDTFKEMTAGAKVGNFGVVRGTTVGMAGEQAVMEAPFMKAKRRDFAGLPRAHVERLYNRAVEDLQQLAMEGGDNVHQQRENILQRFSRSVSALTGGRVSKNDVRHNVVREKMGGNRYADYFEIDYTDNLSTALEENVSTTKMMAASKEMGLTMSDVFKEGSDMLRAKNPDLDQQGAQKKLAGLMRDQVAAELEDIRSIDTQETIDKYFGGNNPITEEKKLEVEKAIKKLKSQKETLDKLYSGKITSLDDSRLKDQGSMWDFYVSDQTGAVSTAFRVLATSHNIQSPTTGASELGGDYENRVGRATARKRSSLLTSSLVGSSASHTMGALGDKQKMAAEVMQGWLASKSGAASFSDTKFQREVYKGLRQAGVDAKSWFDPEKIKQTKDGAVYETRKGDVPLQQYVQDKFTWDTESGQLIFHGQGNQQVKLQVDAFTTLRDTRRKQAGVLGMVTGKLQTGQSVGGTPIGGSNPDGSPRVLTLTFGGETDIHEGRISAADFHELFGKKTRAQQHFQHTKGRKPTPKEAQAYDKRHIYFGKDARPGEYGEKVRQTVFNEQFDFLEVSLFGDLDGSQEQEIVQALKKSGVSDKMISRTLMGGTVMKRALTQVLETDDPQAEANIESTIDYLRQSNETGGSSIFVETRTGGNSPDTTPLGNGMQKANVGQWADIADRLEGYSNDPDTKGGALSSIKQLRSSVQRIEEEASRIGKKYGDLNNRNAQQELRRVFDKEFKDSVNSGAFMEAEKFFASTLRRSATSLISQMEEMEGRYLGGEYKLAAPQMDMIDKFKGLAKKITPGAGVSDSFIEEVDELMRNANPKAAQGMARDHTVANAANDLHDYMKQQIDEFGRDMHRWRGMGVGEGFIGRSAAEGVLNQLELSHKGMERTLDPNQIDEGTNLTARAKEKLRDANALEGSAKEAALARQEVRSPGSTPGLMMTTIRQPDFTAAGGYESSRLNVLGDDALRAVGRDPSQIHTFSHPLVMASRKEDFDYDLNYMAAVDNSVNAHMQRTTRGQAMPDHLANLWQMMEGAGEGLEGISEQNAADRFESHLDTVQIDGREVSTRRVTTEFGGPQTFGQSISKFFSAAGLAMKAAARGKEARTAYAQQQSIVGQMGAYAKQGAINTKQRNSAFTDLMGRLNRQAEQMVKTNENVTEADIKRQFNQMFNKRTSGRIGQDGVGQAWDFMNQTYEKVRQAQNGTLAKGHNGAFDLLHTAALTEAEITQAVGIEKYKYGEPQEVARRVNNIMQTLHGNHSGGYGSFEDAFGALMDDPVIKENLPFNPSQMFGQMDASAEEKRGLAKKAFRLQYDMNRAMRMAKRAGIRSDYLSSFANISPGEAGAHRGVAMADMQARRQLEAQHVAQVGLPNSAASAVSGDGLQGAVDDFFAAQEFQDNHLKSILGSPSTFQEKFTQTLGDLPIGAKAIGASVAAGAALLTGATAIGGGPGNIAGSEQYDVPSALGGSNQPSYRLGNPQTTRRALQHHERSVREAAWGQRRQPASGSPVAAQRPPTITASY